MMSARLAIALLSLLVLQVWSESVNVEESAKVQETEKSVDSAQAAYDSVYNSGRPIDEVIANAANSSEEFNFFYDEKKKMVKVEYDMVFTDSEWNNLNVKSRRKRTAAIIAGRQGAQRWTNKHIPYQFANGQFSSRDQNEIRTALNSWTQFTCLTFGPASYGNRLHFQDSGGCHSRVGMVGGSQVVGLARGCRYKGIIEHEVGHAIGLHHEQTRPDRDNYVTIIDANIAPQMRFNFQKYTWNTILNLGIPYDFGSIMHYGSTAFSTNGRNTIVTRDPRMQGVIGNRNELSFRDIKTVNKIYNCGGHCNMRDDQCPGEGFVGKDCKCWCPGSPYTHCGTGGSHVTNKPIYPVTTQSPGGCQDRHVSCAYWSRHDQCNQNPNYMHNYCRKSCGLCGHGSEKPAPSQKCVDFVQHCPVWTNLQYCTSPRYSAYMASNCPKSCGLCSDSASSACEDSNQYCSTWSKNGECQKNPNYMLLYCKQSCGVCHSGSSSESCDDSNKTYCKYWAQIGECQRNPGYMMNNCKMSCGQCDKAAQDPMPTAIPCIDSYNNCGDYKERGFCYMNYMRLACRSTCGYCNQ